MINKSIFASICYFLHHITANSTTNQDLCNGKVIFLLQVWALKTFTVLSCKKQYFHHVMIFCFINHSIFCLRLTQKKRDICLNLQLVNYSVLDKSLEYKRKTGKKRICIRNIFFAYFPIISTNRVYFSVPI